MRKKLPETIDPRLQLGNEAPGGSASTAGATEERITYAKLNSKTFAYILNGGCNVYA
jgi:hypothetical protein